MRSLDPILFTEITVLAVQRLTVHVSQRAAIVLFLIRFERDRVNSMTDTLTR